MYRILLILLILFFLIKIPFLVLFEIVVVFAILFKNPFEIIIVVFIYDLLFFSSQQTIFFGTATAVFTIIFLLEKHIKPRLI